MPNKSEIATKLESHLVEYILAVRSEYLRTVNGRPPPSYWQTIQARVQSAAMQCDTASEWAASVQRGMRVPGLDNKHSKVLVELVHFCDERDQHNALLNKCERDHAILIGLAMQVVDEAKNKEKTP